MFKNKVISEIGSVHDGSFGNALKLIEASVNSGADIVKFQTHLPEAETTADAPCPSYFNSENRYDYFARTGFSKLQWRELASRCDDLGVGFLSSPFSIEAVDLLLDVGVQALKIPSGEVTNIPMIEHIARKGVPCIISSGMSNWIELDAAIAILNSDVPALCVMQCSSIYPCPAERVGLNVIRELADRYSNIDIGFSDHYEGPEAGTAAAALGAVCIEKHFTFSRLMYGSDAPLAMEPLDFAKYSRGIKNVWKMLANPVDKNDISGFESMRNIFQKSIYLKRDKVAGEVLQMDDLAFLKPADGILAQDYKLVLGKQLVRDCCEGELLTLQMLSASLKV